ncbi:hypothetical protein ACJX0J_006057, partial [Zea mays]
QINNLGAAIASMSRPMHGGRIYASTATLAGGRITRTAPISITCSTTCGTVHCAIVHEDCLGPKTDLFGWKPNTLGRINKGAMQTCHASWQWHRLILLDHSLYLMMLPNFRV